MKLELKITKKQKQFCEAWEDEVLFGGAAGGGKSYGQIIDALLYALRYPGSKQLLLRRTFPDLERSLIQTHLEVYPREVYRYNASNHRGRFDNGSTIEFGYLDHESDVYQYQGAEYDVIRFDELTQFTERMYKYLQSRLRGANDFPKAMKSTCNPGGIGHVWVKARFIDTVAAGSVYRTDEGTRLFLPSKVTDNVVLMEKDPGYLQRLERLDPATRAALKDGDWDILEGQFFEEFSREIHVIPAARVAEPVRRYITLDYGMDMLAAYWIAVDPEGRAVVYRELYEGRDNGKGESGRGHIVREAARRVRDVNAGERYEGILAPPDLWNRNRDTGRSTADLFREAGLALTPTGNHRVDGWRAVREWLAMDEYEDGSRRPRMQIMDCCPNLIRCLPQLQRSTRDPEDVAGEPHELTHGPDALRGFCSFHTRRAETARKEEKDPLMQFYAPNMQTAERVLGLEAEIHVI